MPKKMTLLIDSREQLPLEFAKDTFDEIRVEGLPTGDYWSEIDSHQIPIAFERKGHGDLYSTMTQGYERFRREIEKANEFGLHLILVIEGTMRDIAKGYEHSQFSGASMLKKLAMLHVKYGLVYHFFQDRGEMARFIYETFDAVRRYWTKEAKAGVALSPPNLSLTGDLGRGKDNYSSGPDEEKGEDGTVGDRF